MARRSDHTRDELRALALRAARDIVSRDGPAALSTRRVASAIGYSPGSLYVAFQNLDDLVLQVNLATLDELNARMRGAIAVDATQSLLALARAYVGFAFEHPALWSLIFERPRPGQLPPAYSVRVEQLFALVEHELRRLASVRTATEIHAAAQALWAGVHGVCHFGLTGRLGQRDAAATVQAAVTLVSLYLAGLQGPVLIRSVTNPSGER